jgi:hypothetical protein
VAAVAIGACKRRGGAELHAPQGAAEWEGRFAVAFDDGYTREPINLEGRAPHDVLDQRLFAARLGHAAIVALVQVDQVWGKGRYQGRQDQFLDIEIERLLIGELPKGVADDQLLRIRGDEELPGTLQGTDMLLFVRWAPGQQPEYHHHVMPADPELLEYVEALVDHAKKEGVLDDTGKVRKNPGRKRGDKGKGKKKPVEEPDEAPE